MLPGSVSALRYDPALWPVIDTAGYQNGYSPGIAIMGHNPYVTVKC